MPGNICAHTHFYGAYARGMGIPGSAPKDFPEILQKLWFRLDQALDHDSVMYSAYVCIIDAIKHGTTTLIDHHASPDFISGSLDVIAQVVDQTGIRASLCYEVTDRGGEQRLKAGVEENLRFIRLAESTRLSGGRISALFGLHAGLTLSEETLAYCRKANTTSAGFHIHVAEDPADEYDSLAKSGMRTVDRLNHHGILGRNSIVAHAVHVDHVETKILAETGTWVTHQPRSNMNNAVGMAQVESMLRAGVRLGLGNDGMSNDMWEEWKATYFVHKLWHRDPRRMSAADIQQMAIYNNSELATELFQTGKIGVIEPGAQADLIFVDYHPYTPLNSGNLPWHIVFGFHSSMITSTMVAGKFLMRDRELLTVDEEKIACEALKTAPNVWKKFQELSTNLEAK
jgi:putative selenium metabolism protein SsnA